MSPTQWLAGAGVTLDVVAVVTYVVGILHGSVRPQRMSWGLWTLIGILGLEATRAGGAGVGIVVLAAIVGGHAVVFLLSLTRRYGKPGGTHRDRIVACTVAGTLISGRLLGIPASIEAVIAVGADCLAVITMLRAVWTRPETEALGPWMLGTAAMCCGAASIQHLSLASLAYPVYLAASNFLIVVVLGVRLRRRRLAKFGHSQWPVTEIT